MVLVSDLRTCALRLGGGAGKELKEWLLEMGLPCKLETY